MKHYQIWASGFSYCFNEYARSKKQARIQFLKKFELDTIPKWWVILQKFN
ncbi:MAG: hypothetical protein RLY40_1002 [Pseudomonadota bacterium]|jgi:hypothetical protein